jgi:hypothetical protein
MIQYFVSKMRMQGVQYRIKTLKYDQLFQKAIAHPCPGLDKIMKAFSKHPPVAGGRTVKELQYTMPHSLVLAIPSP